MHLDAGKRQSRVLSLADKDSGKERRVEKVTAMRVFCRRSKLNFLVDTGASISCLPATDESRALGAEAMLLAANGSTIATYGKKKLDLELGLRREFQWEFAIAEVTMPILGIDCLAHFGLNINLRTMQNQYPSTSLAANASRIRVSAANRVTGVSEQIPERCRELLKKYRSITEPSTLKQFPPLQHRPSHTDAWTPVVQ